MNPTALASLARSLPALRRSALLTLGMWAFTETFLSLLRGQVATGLTIGAFKWIDCASLLGATFGFSTAILWIGQVLDRRLCRLLWGCLLLGTGLVAWCYLQPNFGGLYTAVSTLSLACLPGGLLLGTVALLRLTTTPAESRPVWIRAFGWLTMLFWCLGFATAYGLQLTGLLFPLTWDYYIYHLDALLAPWATSAAATLASGNPELHGFTFAAYDVLVPAFFAVIGLCIRFGRVDELRIWRLLLLPYFAGWTAYAIVPLCGPIYVFQFNGFPGHMPAAADIAMLPVQVSPTPRNGMPSMHLSGALFVFVAACALRQRLATVLTGLLVASTAWATMAMGEHYVMDLVVALPFSAALVTGIVRPRLYASPTSGPWFWSCAGLTIWWLLTLRFAPVWLISQPWLVQVATLTSLACAVPAFTLIIRALRGDAGTQPVAATVVATAQSAAVPRWVTGVFFFSGVAGLLYEVVFSKALAVTFGSTALASYTVLATYMGGMAVGAWLGGMWVERLSKPLLAYVACEAAIGLYAVLTPALFSAMQSVYASLAADVDPSSPWLTALRVTLGAVVLGVPTIMMGATLPFMFKHVKGLGVSSGNAIARLYGANVLGAAVGSTVAGYVFLPAVGRNGATYLAAIASLMIALYALDRFKRAQTSPDGFALGEAGAVSAPMQVERTGQTERPLMWIGLAVLIIGGGITLGLEVIYMHLLAVVAGNSAYAFALMLSAFLIGLGVGSEVGRRCLANYSPLLIVSVAELGLCASIAITAHGWDGIPTYFSAFGPLSHALPFSAREAIRALVCLMVMIPPALCIGVAYPAAMSMAAEGLGRSQESQGVGMASALNTLGNIAGVLVTGFVLLPAFGSLQVIQGFAVIAFALALPGIAMLLRLNIPQFPRPRPIWLTTAAAAVGAATALSAYPEQWNYQQLTTGANVYFREQGWGQHVEHAESVSGGLTSVARGPTGVHTLLTNGKFQGNDATGGEMVAQAGFALATLLHTSDRDRALVIGYGTGMTTNVMHAAGFRNVDMVELSSDIVSLADKYFGTINEGVLHKPGVRAHITDGRNFLLTQNLQFDAVSIEISSIWFAGAANLYNKEFYELVRRRLKPDGVLQQWVQLHHIYPIDLVYVIGSVRANFRYVWLYYIGGQGVLVASNSPRSQDQKAALARMLETPAMAKYVSLFAGHPEELAKQVQLEPSDVDRMIGSVDPEFKVLTSTDINLFLEYSTPKGNAHDKPNVVENNLLALKYMAGRHEAVQRPDIAP